MSRTRIVFYVLFLATVWGADVAGTFLLPDRDQVVLNGVALVVSFAMKSRCSERKAQAHTHKAVAESHKREMFLLAMLEEMTKAAAPEPEPGNDRFTGPLRVVSGL